MIITKELLKEKFKEYNELYFDNKLGKCNFSFFNKNLSYLGWYQSKEDKRERPNDKIWIGTSIIWTMDLLKSVLIHEMVHMYVYRIEGHKTDGIFGHGKHFRKHAKRLKKHFNIEIIKIKNVNYINKKFSPKLWERIILWFIDR